MGFSPDLAPMSAPTASAPAQTAFEARMIAFFVEAATVLGVPKSVAMIYGALFGSARPLSFGEIEQKLGISKGSVSQGLRVLREIGAVEVADGEMAFENKEDGGAHPQATRYRPVVELRLLLTKLVADKIQPHLKASGDTITELTQSLPGVGDPEAAEVLETRLKHLQVWQRRSKDLLPLLKAFLR